MIPRFKPALGLEELGVLFRARPGAVAEFEHEFARVFEARQAIAFPYGRSGLWAFFKALNIENAEVIMPAYTCIVVAHATVLSGNVPHFVDITLYDYNMDLDQVEAAINERTRAVVSTHLFGYPLDVGRLGEVVRAAEARYGHKIWVVQDCAHAFGARWQGRLVCNAGDAALFGLNISKTITSIFGGMLTTNDPALAERLRAWRDAHFARPSRVKAWRRRLYLLAVYLAFDERFYGLVNWLEESTPLLNRLTRAYHLDERVHFPPDSLEQMLDVEAGVGLAQLRKYSEVIQWRQKIAQYYDQHLQGAPGLTLPPLIDGATYSHYVVRVEDRAGVLREMRRRGVQVGQLIEYSIPHIPVYRKFAGSQSAHATSLQCSRTTINLPVYYGVKPDHLIEALASLEL